MEEVALILESFATNESQQSMRLPDREALTKEICIADIKKMDELGLWVPGLYGTQQPKTVQESIDLRTGPNAPSLVNRFTKLNTFLYKVRNQLAKVQQASGYKPPSGCNSSFDYWKETAAEAGKLLQKNECAYLEHFSYICPDTWRLDDALKEPAAGRDECSFSAAATEWFAAKVRPDLLKTR